MSYTFITGGHSTTWYQICRVENVSKKYISLVKTGFDALTNFVKLINFRLVYGKVYFHPPGQFLALNGRMGYKIRPGEPIKSRKKFKGIAITKT